ncbi:MAG: nucleotidyltransferase domain-containing protein [Nitrospirota bacterium]
MSFIAEQIPLNYNEQCALKGIIDELVSKYPFIKRIILYGSKARGDFIEDSDVDLLFIVEGDVSRSIKMQMNDIIYNYELSHDVVISAIFVSERDFRDKVNTFLMKVRKEGIVIWSIE